MCAAGKILLLSVQHVLSRGGSKSAWELRAWSGLVPAELEQAQQPCPAGDSQDEVHAGVQQLRPAA